MKIFDETERTNSSVATYSERMFSFINRSAMPEFALCRRIMEECFSRYSESERNELRSRLRSEDDHNHLSASYELSFHELLLRLGCSVEVHPKIQGTSRSPDFLATFGGDSFYVEATLATFQSSEEIAAQARKNSVYDTLTRRVDSTNFFLDLDVKGSPKTQPPSKQFSDYVNRQLKSLDPDEVAALHEVSGRDSVPCWHFSHDGWQIAIRPIPKKAKARGRQSNSPIGMIGTGVRSVDHRTPLRTALEEKAGVYGDLPHPYIIAVNALELIDDIDIMEALFGKEQWAVSFGSRPDGSMPEPKFSRLPDGFWTSPSGPRNTRVSCVLITSRLKIWDVSCAVVCLYHNPWSKQAYSSKLCDLPQSRISGDRMIAIDGKSIKEILNV